MLFPVRDVVAITPVWNESLAMIQSFQAQIESVRSALVAKGISFRHFFLDDGAVHLPDESSILFRHEVNTGLAQTLSDGYEKVLRSKKGKPDVIARLDCQEHDPAMILQAVDHLMRVPVDAVFIPVVYNVKGEPSRRMVEVTQIIASLSQALHPSDLAVVESIYNQVFPLGFQVFRADLLSAILPKYQMAISAFQRKFNKPATWGFDLLSLLLSAEIDPERIDFIFGGWMEPWESNRGSDKVEAQRTRVKQMLELHAELNERSADASVSLQ